MPERQYLPHEIPSWVDDESAIYFITICCRHRGAEILTPTLTATQLLDSVAYQHERGHWFAHLFLLMPDHCHALLSFPHDQEVAKTIRDWKRWTARELQIDWQIDFFEHRLRNGESGSQKWDYIRQNPVRASLVERIDDWPFVWQASEDRWPRLR